MCSCNKEVRLFNVAVVGRNAQSFIFCNCIEEVCQLIIFEWPLLLGSGYFPNSSPKFEGSS